jgi:class 3 adenylate cyclase/DNA-binding beta-propeller fold protein YncE
LAEQVAQGVVTIMHTDVEGSTDLTTRLGDAVARPRILEMKRVVREQVARHGGREIDNPGDGFMLTFSSTRRAIECAIAIQSELASFAHEHEDGGIRVRIGLHVGEVVGEDDQPFGAALSASARVMSRAKGGEILVSEVVRRLAGTMPGISFRDRGRVRMKGFDERWRLYEVVWSEPALAGQVPRTRRRRLSRRRGAFALALVLLLAAVVTSILLLRKGSSTLSIPPGTNPIAVIDADSMRLLDKVPAGRVAVSIAASPSSVFALNIADNSVSRIDARTHENVVTIGVGVTGLDPSPTSTAYGSGQPTAIAYGSGQAWVASVLPKREVVVPINQEGRFAEQPVTFARGPHNGAPQIAAGGESVWVGAQDEHELVQIDALTRRVTRRASVPGFPQALAVEDGSVWFTAVTGQRSGVLGRLDHMSFTPIVRFPEIPGDVAVGYGSVWVVVNAKDAVWRIDRRTKAVDQTIPVGDGPTAIAVGAGAVWVANARDGTISKIDPATNAVRTVRVEGTPRDLAVADGKVWVVIL